MPEDPPEKSAERPLECSECRKNIATLYTVIEQDSISHTVMCSSCPQLERRLNGTRPKEQLLLASQEICKDCGTSATQIRSGIPVGCSQCYVTFTDLIINELVYNNKVPSSIGHVAKNQPLHSGRKPGEIAEISSSARLQSLNEALNEALSREDYEQAAWLRDQIKKLTEQS